MTIRSWLPRRRNRWFLQDLRSGIWERRRLHTASALPSTKSCFAGAVLFALMTVVAAFGQPVGTLFTYQGRLASGNGVANGSFDFQFELCDAPTNGASLGDILTNAVPVSNGVFTVSLDFGAGVFAGQARWLQISVKTNLSASFALLTPRQPLTAVPYALDSATVDSVPASQISGVLPDSLLPTNVALVGQSQVFTGSNYFGGPAIFTNAANIFAGQFFGDGSGLTNIPPVTSFLTTNSTSAQITAAISKGGLIWFQPGDYWSVGNLELTNNTVILGWNAVLHAAAGLTNFLIDENLTATNISIYGLSVTADRYMAYNDPNFLSLTPWPSPYYQPNLINQSGMRLNMAGGGVVSGCSAYGFGGHGFLLFSVNGSDATAYVSSFFYENHAHDNGVGVAVIGAPYDYPGIPYAPASLWAPVEVTDEHQLISGNEMFNNGIGLYAPAGNPIIIGNKITGNNFGIVLMSGPNSTHGEIIGNTLNHNNYAIAAVGTTGAMIRNNMLLDVNAVYFCAAQYIVFDGNQFNGEPGLTLTVTNFSSQPPSFVTISHNSYTGNWGTNVIVNTNFGTGAGSAYVYGNRSLTVSNDTDGSMASLQEIGAAATTNYHVPGGATFYVTNGVIVTVH